MGKKRDTRTSLFAGRFAAIAILLVCTAAVLAQTSPPQTPAPQTSAPPAVAPPALPSVTSNLVVSVAELTKLADQQTQARNYDGAIATWESVFAQATDPHDKATVWNHIANVYQLKGDYSGSMHAMQQAVELWPTNAVLVTDMALLFQVEGDEANAHAYYEKAISLDPDNPLALNNLAYLIADHDGDLDQALSYALAAKDKLPGFVEVHDTLGLIYLKKNLTTEALNEFGIALVGTPDSAEYHYHFALALYQRGDLMAAFQHGQYALSKSPPAALAQKIRNLLGNLAPQVQGLPQPPAATPQRAPQRAPARQGATEARPSTP